MGANTIRISRMIFAMVLAVALGQIIYFYPDVPDIVASHFDGAGNPNGWSSKLGFFCVYLGVLLLTVVVFVFAPVRLSRTSAPRLKLPNHEYWLAPENRQSTLDFIQVQFIWFAIVNTVLAIFVVQLVIQANLRVNRHLDDSVWWALGLYGVFVGGWLIRFFVRFTRAT